LRLASTAHDGFAVIGRRVHMLVHLFESCPEVPVDRYEVFV
jgi:hypothetical protein